MSSSQAILKCHAICLNHLLLRGSAQDEYDRMTARQMKPVIISGAGLVGLTLAQALQRDGIPFEIYERDSGMFSRYGGWAISLHWIIPALQTCLTPDAFTRLMALHNDPESLKSIGLSSR